MKASKLLRMYTAPVGKAVFILLLAASISSVQASSLFEDNFDSYPVGAPPEGWTELYTLPGGVPISREEAAAQGVTVQVNDSAYFAGGQSVHFLDTSDYTFSHWSGPASGSSNPTTIVMNEDKTVTANFSITEQIRVTSPNGGESWQRGTTHDITWIPTGIPAATVHITLWKSGVKVKTLVDLTADDASWQWEIPVDQELGSDYKVHVVSDNVASDDFSDQYFSIVDAPGVTIAPLIQTYPNEQAPGGNCYVFKAYEFTLNQTADLNIQLTAQAWSGSQNPSGDDDDLIVDLDGEWLNSWNAPDSIDGWTQWGSKRTINLTKAGVSPGKHTVRLFADEKPVLYSLIVSTQPMPVALSTYPNEQAPGGNCYVFEAYEFTLNQTADLNIQLTAQAWSGSQNPSGDDDDLIVNLDGEWLNSWNAPDSIDGNTQWGTCRTINLTKTGVSPGKHTLRLCADEKPKLYSISVIAE